MKIQDGKPPSNTKRVYRWDDLPKAETAGAYLIENEGAKPVSVIVRGKRRRVLEGLMQSPLYAASYARLSDHVDHLRREGINIRTDGYRNDPETGRETYGVYTIESTVTRIERGEVAA